MRTIPYGRQTITEEDIQAVITTLKSDFLTQGPAIDAFEEAFAEYIGCQYAVAVANGTAALHLAALALDVKPGQKVITTPITFAASANCVEYCGGEVDFVDIDPDTLLMDINALRKKLEAAPKGTYAGVIPVDFAGSPVHLDVFRKLASAYGLWILEDACHAPGGYFVDANGRKQYCGNGTYADLAIFSFHPVKHIACGEGGMITTNNKDLYDKLMVLRTHGITKDPNKMRFQPEGGWYHEMQTLGYNYRMPDMLCALGSSQLKQAHTGMERRHVIAARYEQAFAGTAIKTYPALHNDYHGYHLFIINIPNRKELYDKLREVNIFAQVHYIPVHLHPYYRDKGWKPGDFPYAEAYYAHGLSIPMFPGLTDEEQAYVIEHILKNI